MNTFIGRILRQTFSRQRKSFPYGRCFMSHSYQDQSATQLLRQVIANRAKLEIFPPITVPPEEMVSDKLLSAIRKCDTLIYIVGGRSNESAWVVLERDYALRSRLGVYSFDPESGAVARDNSQPMDLPVFASYHREDGPVVLDLIRFMSRKRHFDIFFDEDTPRDANPFETIQGALDRRLKGGGYVTLFWSRRASESRFVQNEVRHALDKYGDRVMPALLDDAALPDQLDKVVPVRLYGADGKGIDRRRLDDLIVRLYWLIWRNSRGPKADA